MALVAKQHVVSRSSCCVGLVGFLLIYTCEEHPKAHCIVLNHVQQASFNAVQCINLAEFIGTGTCITITTVLLPDVARNGRSISKQETSH